VSQKSISNFVKDFIEFEAKNSLFSMKIHGFNIWEYIRHDIWNEITNSILDIDISKTAYNKRRKFYQYPLKSIKYIYYGVKNIFLNNKYQVILLNTSINRIIDGKNVDMYIYPILKKLVNNYNILLIYQEFNNNKLDYPCDILFKPNVAIKGNILSYVVKFSKKDKLILKRLENSLIEKFNVQMDILSIVRNVIGYKIKDRKKRFKKIFKKFKPKIFIYVDDGSMQGVLEAAHEQGISTVELQHSTVSNLNLQYQWYPKTFQYNTIPKYILSFGNYWKDSFKLKSTIIPVGFPYFNLLSQKYNRTDTDDKSNSLIISSVILSNKDLIRMTLDLSKLLTNYKIYYKLRDVEYDSWKSYYPREFIEKDNIIIIDNDETHLYEYFRKCKYQIGVNSTTLYEGIGYGLITFILKSGWYEEMTTLSKGGHAFLVENAKEIAFHIRNNSIPENPLNVNSIFRQNSLQTIRNEIDSIINKYNYV